MKLRITLSSGKEDSSELEKLIQRSPNKKTKKPCKMKRLKCPYLWLLWGIPLIAVGFTICVLYLKWWDLDLPFTTKLWAQAVNFGWLDARAATDGSNIVNMNLVIAGLARDIAPTLPRLLLHLEDLICSFRSVFVLVFEDGSEDNTRDMLNLWAKHAMYGSLCFRRFGWIPKVMILTKPTELRGLEKMVYLRNEQLNIIEKFSKREWGLGRPVKEKDGNVTESKWNASTRPFSWNDTRLLVLDFDLHAFDVQALLNVIDSRDLSSRVICANGITNAGMYRDWFATILEDGAWTFEKRSLRERLEFTSNLNQKELMSVRSCFGGLAVYNFDTLFRLRCRYTTTKEYLESDNRTFVAFEGSPPDRICEHIGLHRCLWSGEGSIIIRSDLYAFYGCTKSSSSKLRKYWPSLQY